MPVAQSLQNLVALLAEAEQALSGVTVILDQHSRASKARALAALKAAQYEASALLAQREEGDRG